MHFDTQIGNGMASAIELLLMNQVFCLISSQFKQRYMHNNKQTQQTTCHVADRRCLRVNILFDLGKVENSLWSKTRLQNILIDRQT